MHITLIAGARPNFMKVSPIIQEIIRLKQQGVNIGYRLVHTGQHFDRTMSQTFFQDLNIPEPDINLNAGGGTQAEQTAAIMLAFEKYLKKNPTDVVIVVGDVNSTMACAITAKKEQIPLAHVEGGIRSFDNTMPEEINRKVTDSITDYFFTTSETANDNLLKEGVPLSQIFFVGNVMIDTLLQNLHKLRKPVFYDEMQLKEKEYFVLTLHRPNNVDDQGKLENLLTQISLSACNSKIIFPVHPRTSSVLKSFSGNWNNIILVEPMGYLEFMYLVKNSMAVITDSGGITEETTVLHIPCMTLRDNTERPETCEFGTNELLGAKPDNIQEALSRVLHNNWKKGKIPPLWDGNASHRIISHLMNIFEKK
jgi:UDP-N-acetylglucosamine 2-epimerase (non-hydrolysing)